MPRASDRGVRGVYDDAAAAATKTTMASQGTGYDLSASTYSSDGRIFQIEYATKAVENAGTAIGLRTRDGVVFGVENLIQSKLLVPGSNQRIHQIDRHVGMTTAGLISDGKHLSGRAREEASNFLDTYKQAVPVKVRREPRRTH